MTHHSGRHFLQLPGPTNTPDRVLRAISRATIDHRGPEFRRLVPRLLDDLRRVFKTEHDVFVYPASGSGGWEAALVNTLSPGARVVAFTQGHFARAWAKVAGRLGYDVDLRRSDPRRGLTAQQVRQTLDADTGHDIAAVLVVHNDTSTGVTSDLRTIGDAVRASGHPALLMVDAVSSLAVTDLRHDEWGVDVTVTGSQKGLMLPPGLSLLAASPRAMEAHERSTSHRAYWSWSDQLEANANGVFPYTPATNLLFGLEEALAMLFEEGLEEVFRRHARFARASRAAVERWGLEPFALDACEASGALTAVLVPDGHDADELRALILDRFDMALGTGLGELKGKVFRIGHLGDLNALSLLGALAGVEMGLGVAGVPHGPGGVDAAMEVLIQATGGSA